MKSDTRPKPLVVRKLRSDLSLQQLLRSAIEIRIRLQLLRENNPNIPLLEKRLRFIKRILKEAHVRTPKIIFGSRVGKTVKLMSVNELLNALNEPDRQSRQVGASVVSEKD